MNQIISMLLLLPIIFSGCVSSDGGQTEPTRSPTHADARLEDLFLDPQTETILIDIDYVEGREPSRTAMDGLRENLEAVFPHKEVVIGAPGLIPRDHPSRDHRWTRGELEQVATRHTYQPRPTEASINIFYLDGTTSSSHHGDSSAVAGLYSASLDSIFVFPDVLNSIAQIDSHYLPHPAYEEYERAVLSHEVGHAIGLVDNGIPMVDPRLPPAAEDPCRCHSARESSVLYYRLLEGNWMREKLESGQHIPYRYDDADLEDVRAFLDADS